MSKKWTSEAERQAYYLTRNVDKAIRDYNMIQEGDRILVGVSGGKDSMALLRLLNYRRRSSLVKYDLVAAHIIGDATGNQIYPPESFIEWLESEGVPFVIREMIIPDAEKLPMNCERCAWNRRRTLFEIAEREGCNIVALGHHLEDFSHTALMNLFLHGRLETMAFAADYFQGKFTLIRPLAYLRESSIARFARACEFPLFETNCPMAETSSRKHARDFMRQIAKKFKNANVNIVKAATEK